MSDRSGFSWLEYQARLSARHTLCETALCTPCSLRVGMHVCSPLQYMCCVFGNCQCVCVCWQTCSCVGGMV